MVWIHAVTHRGWINVAPVRDTPHGRKVRLSGTVCHKFVPALADTAPKEDHL